MVASDAALFVFVLCPLNTVASLGGTAPGDARMKLIFVGEFQKNTGQTMLVGGNGIAANLPPFGGILPLF